MCYHKIRREGNGKCSGTGAKPHSAVSSFQNGAARTAQGTAPMAPPLFGAEFIRRRQKRRKKARLSKMPSQPARDKGCGTQRLDTHNAACGIETASGLTEQTAYRRVSTHTMLRAALKLIILLLSKKTPYCLDTHNAACGIETCLPDGDQAESDCLDTHNAACGIETLSLISSNLSLRVSTHTMLRAALKPEAGR